MEHYEFLPAYVAEPFYDPGSEREFWTIMVVIVLVFILYYSISLMIF